MIKRVCVVQSSSSTISTPPGWGFISVLVHLTLLHLLIHLSFGGFGARRTKEKRGKPPKLPLFLPLILCFLCPSLLSLLPASLTDAHRRLVVRPRMELRLVVGGCQCCSGI